nr:hypothetical protein [Nevskia sp.]
MTTVKTLAAAGKVRTTHSARVGASRTGPRISGHARGGDGDVATYLKLAVVDDLPIVSFKEL